MKSRITKNQLGERWLIFNCPGCEELHGIPVDGKDGEGRGPWEWDGDIVNPTLKPSVQTGRCHFTLSDGILDFHSDSEHGYAGIAIPLEDLHHEKINLFIGLLLRSASVLR